MTYFYYGFLYKWEKRKAEKTFLDDHITICDAVQAIFDCQEPEEQSSGRWKYVGFSNIGIIAVITEEDETRIVTAWKASKEEQKNYHRNRG